MKLYRAVSFAELVDIRRINGFRVSAGSMEGKWFAERHMDAAEWGRRFYLWDGQPFFLIEIELQPAVVDLMTRYPNLDTVGPARYAGALQLDIMNRAPVSINELPDIPIRNIQ